MDLRVSHETQKSPEIASRLIPFEFDDNLFDNNTTKFFKNFGTCTSETVNDTKVPRVRFVRTTTPTRRTFVARLSSPFHFQHLYDDGKGWRTIRSTIVEEKKNLNLCSAQLENVDGLR